MVCKGEVSLLFISLAWLSKWNAISVPANQKHILRLAEHDVQKYKKWYFSQLAEASKHIVWLVEWCAWPEARKKTKEKRKKKGSSGDSTSRIFWVLKGLHYHVFGGKIFRAMNTPSSKNLRWVYSRESCIGASNWLRCDWNVGSTIL